MQTAQGPKLSQPPKSVTAFPPRDWWLSAPDAAEGGAQLPNTLATGNGNTGTSSSAAMHVGSNSSWRAHCLCSGAPIVAPSRQRKSPRKHLTLDEEGSSQATPRTCALDASLPLIHMQERLLQQKIISSQNLPLSSNPSPSPALWKAGVTLGQPLGGHRVMGTATTSRPPAPAAPKAMPQGWCRNPKRSDEGAGAGLAVPPETRSGKAGDNHRPAPKRRWPCSNTHLQGLFDQIRSSGSHQLP